MDPSNDIATADLMLGDEGEDLWSELLPHLSRALSDDESPYLDAIEAAAHGAGLTQRASVGDLLDAYADGSRRIRELIVHSGGPDAEVMAQRLLGLERPALTLLATAYADGLEDTIDRLRRLADESSPVDTDSGAIKPAEFGERLSLEVERCRRMDLPLGLVELALAGAAGGRHAVALAAVVRHRVGACLRESLRRYDSVGLTEDGAFVMVLPDISRRGLAGAAERIRRQVGSCAGHAGPDVTFALAHYDLVDASAGEMLSALDHGLQEARQGNKPLAWA